MTYNHSGQPIKGLVFDVLTEVSKRGGFDIIYKVVKTPKGLTLTQQLEYALPKVDILASKYYIDSTSRRSAGIGFTYGFVDASLVLITTSSPTSAASGFFSCFQPFSFNLWICIILLLAAQTLVHWFLEKDSRSTDGDAYTLLQSLYDTFGTFTGGGGNMEPRRASTQIIIMGFFFAALVLVASYTANLASLLITAPSTTTPYTSLEQANRQRATICVLYGTTAYSYLTDSTSYPGIRLKVNRTLSSNQGDKLLLSVVDGQCSGAVLNLIDWQFYMNEREVNSQCNLVQVETVQTYVGAFPYLVDFSKHCTSFVETVLSTLLIGMRSDGVLDDIVETNLLLGQDLFCDDEEQPSEVLSVKNMSGVLIIYVGCCGVGILRYLYEKMVESARERKKKGEEEKGLLKKNIAISPEGEVDKNHPMEYGGGEDMMASKGHGVHSPTGNEHVQVEDIDHLC